MKVQTQKLTSQYSCGKAKLDHTFGLHEIMVQPKLVSEADCGVGGLGRDNSTFSENKNQHWLPATRFHGENLTSIFILLKRCVWCNVLDDWGVFQHQMRD